ncbi:hypothetical protein AGMMS49992_07800 [Clostridia bacterium]|nr:hypothetical protein AGMMS49992_07800 [Clostridia bacterium]
MAAEVFDNLSDVAFVGGKYVTGDVRAVILRFHGLGFTGAKTSLDMDELEWASHGGLIVFPYYGPWSWMNAGARKFVDAIVERVYDEFKLADSVPLIITGGSMGGHAALNYAHYSQRKPAAVVSLYPCIDTEYHSTERPDLPRTFILAYGMDGRPIKEVFHENSPTFHADTMPRVPYLVLHGDLDKAVSKSVHSDVFVKNMREAGHDVEYIEAWGMEHGPFIDLELYRRYVDFVSKAIAG